MVVFVKYILSSTIKPWFILLFRIRITIWAIYGDSQWDGRNHLDTVKPLSKWDCLWMQQIVIKCWTGFQEHWCLEPRGKLRTENKTQPTFYQILQCFVTANQHQMYLSIVNMKQHLNTYLHKYTGVLGFDHLEREFLLGIKQKSWELCYVSALVAWEFTTTCTTALNIVWKNDATDCQKLIHASFIACQI